MWEMTKYHIIKVFFFLFYIFLHEKIVTNLFYIESK
jgi:hypothetical protein